MKRLLIFLLLLSPCFAGSSQHNFVRLDSVTSKSHSIKLIAQVKDMNQDYMTIEVEEVVSFTSGIGTTPSKGDEILVRLPGREMPRKESRIEVDLQEKIEVGAMPSGYIMVEYRTIE